MKHLIFGILVASLSACGTKKSGGSGSASPTGPQEVRKITNASNCQNGRPANQVEGRWQTVFQAEQITLTLTFDFRRDGGLTLSNDCSMPTGRLTARTSSIYYLDNGNLIIPASSSHEERTGNMSCSARIDKGSVRYSFEGSCLVMIDSGGEKLYLTSTY